MNPLHLIAHTSSRGPMEWIAELLVRAATYRIMGAIPLPVVIVIGLAALAFVVYRRKRRDR